MKKFKKLLPYIFLIFLSLLFLSPVIVTFTNSFMGLFETVNRYTKYLTPSNHYDVNNGFMHYVNLSLIPNKVTAEQYLQILFDSPQYLGAFVNSIKLSLPIVLGQIFVGITAAYVFEMGNIEYKEQLFFIYIVTMFLPLQVSLVPNYMTIEFFKITNGFLAIILPAVFSPFPVFLFRQYLRSMPKEYVEAAKLDGAGHFRIIFSIILPLLKPAIAAVGILSFSSYWNLVDQALIFIKNAYDEPLSIYLPKMAQDTIATAFGASVFYMIPAIIVFLFARKELVTGIEKQNIIIK